VAFRIHTSGSALQEVKPRSVINLARWFGKPLLIRATVQGSHHYGASESSQNSGPQVVQIFLFGAVKYAFGYRKKELPLNNRDSASDKADHLTDSRTGPPNTDQSQPLSLARSMHISCQSLRWTVDVHVSPTTDHRRPCSPTTEFI
jgi:hypothetical protein